MLTTTQPGGPGFAPAFVGNGYLAGRQPAEGQGFAQVQLPDQVLPTQSQVHGFYAKAVPSTPPGLPPSTPIERRAALPAWSTLSYDDGSGRYSLSSGQVDAYRQSLDVRTGTLTTQVTLDLDGGPDRRPPLRRHARPGAPARGGGPAAAGAALQRTGHGHRPAGRPGGRAGRRPGHRAPTKTTQWVRLSSVGLGMTATVASTVVAPKGAAVAAGADDRLPQRRPGRHVPGQVRSDLLGHQGSRGGGERRLHRPVRDGGRGLEARGSASATTACEPAPTRRGPRSGGPTSSCPATPGCSGRCAPPSSPCSPACGTTRRGRPRRAACPRTATTATSSGTPRPGCTRPCSPPSRRSRRRACSTGSTGCRRRTGTRPRPAGPARGTRGRARSPAARTHRRGRTPACSRSTSARTSRWPCGSTGWPPATAGGWRPRRWPVLKGIAEFWVSRASRNSDGSYSINTVIPPDEYVEQVDDSVYTNVAARDALRFATQAAALVGPAAVADVGQGGRRAAGPVRPQPRHPPRIPGLSRRRGEAGRRDPAGLPVGEPAAGRR